MIAGGFGNGIAGLFVSSFGIGVIGPILLAWTRHIGQGAWTCFYDKMGVLGLLFAMTQLTLPSILHWILSHRRLLMLWLVIGLIVGVLVVELTPARYEATFVVKMPVSNAVNQNNQILDKEIQFVPNPLEVKKLFLRPEAFSSQTVQACGFQDSNDDRKILVNAITSEVAEYGSGILVSVRLPGKDRLSLCSNVLMADAIAFANAEKNRAIAFIRRFNGVNAWMVDHDAYAPYAIRMSNTPISPNPWKIILGSMCLSLAFGVWLSITLGQLKKRFSSNAMSENA